MTAAMTISSTGPTATSRAEDIKVPRWVAAQSLVFFAGIFVVGLPLRRRVRVHGSRLLLLIALAGSMLSCGNGGSNGGGGQSVPGTTPGTYKFMVDGSYTPNIGTTQPFFSTQPQVFVVSVAIH
jgi:hypothetical protein